MCDILHAGYFIHSHQISSTVQCKYSWVKLIRYQNKKFASFVVVYPFVNTETTCPHFTILTSISALIAVSQIYLQCTNLKRKEILHCIINITFALVLSHRCRHFELNFSSFYSNTLYFCKDGFCLCVIALIDMLIHTSSRVSDVFVLEMLLSFFFL